MRKAPLFVIALALLAFLALAQTLLPDKTFSQMENRVLAERPALTLASMSMSRWADGFETYCADQLPLRDRFVSLYTAWEALTGHRVIEGVILGGDHRLFDRTDAWKPRNVTMNASALAYLSGSQRHPPAARPAGESGSGAALLPHRPPLDGGRGADRLPPGVRRAGAGAPAGAEADAAEPLLRQLLRPLPPSLAAGGYF